MRNKLLKIIMFSVVMLQCILTVSCSFESKAALNLTAPLQTYSVTESQTVSSEPETTEPETTKSNIEKSENQIPLIGHRGYSGEYPESTLNAFSGAFENGFDGIECDVWETDSDDLLVQHDPTTTRTTGKKEYIWRLSKKTRSKFPIIKGDNVGKFRNEKLIIPTLEEVAEIVSKNKGYFYLHIKGNKKYYLTQRGQDSILKILREYGLKDRTLIFGSKDDVEPFLKKGFKTGVYIAPKSKSHFKSVAKWCVKNGVDTLVISNMRRLRLCTKPKNLKSFCKKYKMKFGLYSTKSKKQYDYLCRIGAEFSMSNYYVR